MLAVTGVFFIGITTVRAEEEIPVEDWDLPICLPDAYPYEPQDCLVLGPAADLTTWAQEGIVLPEPPMSMVRTPAEYNFVDRQYIKVTTDDVIDIYDSLAGAVSDSPRRSMPNGFRYFSYSQRAEPEEGIYYLVKTTEWVWGGDVSRITPPKFQGLVFKETPQNNFAFVIDATTPSYTVPGSTEFLSGKNYNRFDIVYVYDQVEVDGLLWYRIGITEWLPKQKVAVVNINPQPPSGVDNGRWIEIDLFQQTLMVYEDNQLKFATLVATGFEPFYTQPGLFQIYERLENEDMTTSDPSDFYYLEDVPWTQYFDEARALHGIYWHNYLGYNRSHGCVNLSIADARWIWEWADIGDYVYAWDPSGETPTDPSFYTGGGP